MARPGSSPARLFLHVPFAAGAPRNLQRHHLERTDVTTESIIKDTSANPAPLGLIGFGMTTILLNIHNAGFFPVNSMIMGMGIFVGGIAQIFAGLLESKKNNTFGLTAFTAYGSFWLSLVAIWVLPALGLAEKTDETAMGLYLALWGFFTFCMFLGTLRLAAGHRRLDPHRRLQDHWRICGHPVRLFGLLHGYRPGAQRGLRPHRAAPGTGKTPVTGCVLRVTPPPIEVAALRGVSTGFLLTAEKF
jgi:hypothetical protein